MFDGAARNQTSGHASATPVLHLATGGAPVPYVGVSPVKHGAVPPAHGCSRRVFTGLSFRVLTSSHMRPNQKRITSGIPA